MSGERRALIILTMAWLGMGFYIAHLNDRIINLEADRRPRVAPSPVQLSDPSDLKAYNLELLGGDFSVYSLTNGHTANFLDLSNDDGKGGISLIVSSPNYESGPCVSTVTLRDQADEVCLKIQAGTPQARCSLEMNDSAGNPRIRLAVDNVGTPRLVTLDAYGRVVWEAPTQ